VPLDVPGGHWKADTIFMDDESGITYVIDVSIVKQAQIQKIFPSCSISKMVKEAQLATFDSLIVFSVSCLVCVRLETAQKGEEILTRRPHSNVAAVRFRAPKVVILARSVE